MARSVKIFREIFFAPLAIFWIALFMPFPLHVGAFGAHVPGGPDDAIPDEKTYLREAAVKLELQTELPGDETAGIIPERYSWWKLFDFRISRRTAAILLALASGVIIAAVMASARRNMWSDSRSRRLEHPAGSSAPPAARRMERARIEADDLAKSGDYAGAMHALLLRSVTEIKNRLGAPISASLTSREIWRMNALSPEERNAFGVIVGGVEISRFGAHEPREDEYLECRRSFESLTSIIAGERQ